jgi:hypothetical protein
MSFDLAVWFEPSPISVEEAAAAYERLCDADEATAAVPTHPKVAAFYRDLTKRYPDLDGLSGEDAELDSPWTASPTVAEASVLVAIGWSHAERVAPFVRQLATQHGLTCYDPQQRTVHGRPTDATPTLVLSSCDGSRSVNPGPDRIDRALRRLSRDNWFALLERTDDRYLQVGYGEQAGTRAGWYALEHRDGSADEHFRAVLTDLNQVITAFKGYARGDETWRRRFAWKKMDI